MPDARWSVARSSERHRVGRGASLHGGGGWASRGRRTALNEAQRVAAEHGLNGSLSEIGPLLVIAGAGSGKTNTLAHRVANLIIHGADPRRILLLTFTRRAAAEMTRRVERIAAGAAEGARPILVTPVSWSGTFHSVGARLLRYHARDIGLDPSFTIHDREDSADLMNLIRHELGLSTKAKRFPAKGSCLSIYSLAVNGQVPVEALLPKHFPGCMEWEAELKTLFAGYVDAKKSVCRARTSTRSSRRSRETGADSGQSASDRTCLRDRAECVNPAWRSRSAPSSSNSHYDDWLCPPLPRHRDGTSSITTTSCSTGPR
jgi:hypothetical protein